VRSQETAVDHHHGTKIRRRKENPMKIIKLIVALGFLVLQLRLLVEQLIELARLLR
jgi:hypothetical protein